MKLETMTLLDEFTKKIESGEDLFDFYGIHGVYSQIAKNVHHDSNLFYMSKYFLPLTFWRTEIKFLATLSFITGRSSLEEKFWELDKDEMDTFSREFISVAQVIIPNYLAEQYSSLKSEKEKEVYISFIKNLSKLQFEKDYANFLILMSLNSIDSKKDKTLRYWEPLDMVIETMNSVASNIEQLSKETSEERIYLWDENSKLLNNRQIRKHAVRNLLCRAHAEGLKDFTLESLIEIYGLEVSHYGD